jgi:PAS domain S-box
MVSGVSTKPIFDDNYLLNKIIFNAYDSIFVTDAEGNIILANQASSKHLNLTVDELIGSNVKDLIKRGYYDHSTALEAAIRKETVTGIVKSLNGLNLMATSTPIFDEEGNVNMVITNSRDKDAMEKYFAELEKERNKALRYKSELDYLRTKNQGVGIIAKSNLMQEVLRKANIVAPTDSTIMIYGDSGTGKEIISNYIHHRSNRSKAPFITVNCAAIPESLIESELFGYDKGAFTGANAKGKLGLFEIADGGTIFLDEIAELPMSLQPKLLRVLETREIRRIGNTVTHQVDVRVIGATNKNLKKMIMNNEFRDDLYYRLNVIPINIPPLTQRPEDIIALAEHFLEEFNRKYSYKKSFSHDAMDILLSYSWPGNARELRNVVERLVIIASGNEIASSMLTPLLVDISTSDHKTEVEIENVQEKLISFPYYGELKEVMNAIEKQYIRQVFAQCNNCTQETAKVLGIHRSALYRKLHDK